MDAMSYMVMAFVTCQLLPASTRFRCPLGNRQEAFKKLLQKYSLVVVLSYAIQIWSTAAPTDIICELRQWAKFICGSVSYCEILINMELKSSEITLDLWLWCIPYNVKIFVLLYKTVGVTVSGAWHTTARLKSSCMCSSCSYRILLSIVIIY